MVRFGLGGPGMARGLEGLAVSRQSALKELFWSMPLGLPSGSNRMLMIERLHDPVYVECYHNSWGLGSWYILVCKIKGNSIPKYIKTLRTMVV